MNYKTRESMREVRLWITNIIVPAVSLAGVSLSIPEVRDFVGELASKGKEKLKNVVPKKKSEKKDAETVVYTMVWIDQNGKARFTHTYDEYKDAMKRGWKLATP